MKERIEVQKTYTIEDCVNNPNKTYVFGDNLIHQGTGGQAIIRYCDNSFGIPTKRFPSMDEDAFFSDKADEMRKVNIKLAALIVYYESNEKPILVFPEDGIGTGRAKLQEKSPQIYNMIKNAFETQFDLYIMP